MNKIQTYLLITFLTVGTLPNFAQERGKRGGDRQEAREALEAKHREYLKAELELTPEEEEAFWPVYDAFKSDMKALREARKKDRKKGASKEEELSDKEALEIINSRFNHKEEKIELEKKYNQQFLDVLPAAKVLKFYDANKKFYTRMLKQQRGGEKKGKEKERPSHRM